MASKVARISDTVARILLCFVLGLITHPWWVLVLGMTSAKLVGFTSRKDQNVPHCAAFWRLKGQGHKMLQSFLIIPPPHMVRFTSGKEHNVPDPALGMLDV